MIERHNMIVDLNELDRCFDYIKSINDANIEKIVWKRGDKKIEVTASQIHEFKFIGLNNVNFPLMFDIENSIKFNSCL